MEKVALRFCYETDIIDVPDDIANDIFKVARAFDKWLYDKSNDHGLWVDKKQKSHGVCFGTADFVGFINRTCLADREEKAFISEESVQSVPCGIRTLNF